MDIYWPIKPATTDPAVEPRHQEAEVCEGEVWNKNIGFTALTSSGGWQETGSIEAESSNNNNRKRYSE